MQTSRFILLFISVFFNRVQSANILYIAGVTSPSHHIWNRALAVGLANKGYNVTYVSPKTDNLAIPKNYSIILLEGIYDGMDDNVNELADLSAWRMMKTFQEWSLFQCERELKSKGLRRLWDYPKDFKFDSVIVDVTIGSCLYHLIERFGYPPTVGVTPFLLPPYVSFGMGNHLFPSYIPWYGLAYSHNMTFVQRVVNYVFTYLDLYLRKNVEDEGTKVAREVFGKNLAPQETIERHISMLLANTDPILDFPQVLPPNIIPVGGLHARKANKLPQDLRDLLDNANNGVIMFSLGTNVRSDKLSEDTQRAILQAFAKIPQTVVWKFESSIKNLPKNVIVRNWLPQNDILGHPNVKLFIGHGGALSTQETIYHGVPMLVIPFFIDQKTNTRHIVNKQFGIEVDFRTITTNSFLQNLNEALNNSKYSRNAKLASMRFRDRSETPLKRAIFWIEYVMRHQGGSFLNSPARDMPLYISSSSDVVVFLGLLAAATVFVLCKILLLMLAFFFYTQKKEKLH